MSNLQEKPVWVDGIYQLTDETPVLGKVANIPGDGPSNIQAQQLADRTQFLKRSLDVLMTGDIPFSSSEAAQLALSEGKIPDGAVVSIFSDSKKIWASQFQNQSGILLDTGKKFLSQFGVMALFQQIYDEIGRQPIVRNLFDIQRTTDGIYIDQTGEETSNASYFSSDKIPVMSGQYYIFFKSVSHVAFYDENEIFISQIKGVASGSTFLTPSNAFYLRFSQTLTTGKNGQMLAKGESLPAEYLGFGFIDPVTAKKSALRLAIDTSYRSNEQNRNLFDKNRSNDGYALSTNGGLTANSSYFVTDYIPVIPGDVYISSVGSLVLCYYDQDFVKIADRTISTATAFTVPLNAYYLRFQCTPLTAKDSLMVIHGAALPDTYVGFGSPTSAYVDTQALTVARSVALSLQPQQVNLFDKSLALLDTAVSYQTGGTLPAAGYFATPKMMVIPGGYFISAYGSGGGAFYKIDGTFLRGFQNLVANTPYAVPQNAYYVRFQVFGLARLESMMFTPGQAVPAGYVPFGGKTSMLPWQGKKIIWLGDSITNNRLYEPYVLAGTGMIELANYGVPGQTVRTMADSLTAETIANADFISILGGTNDYGGNVKLGTIADATSSYDEAANGRTFYHNVFYVLDKIFMLKPGVRVVFSTPMKRGQTDGQSVVYPAANAAGFFLEDYVQAIKDVCSMFSVPVCDLFNNSGINLYNLSIYTNDNLHPNALGSALHARPMIAAFNAA